MGKSSNYNYRNQQSKLVSQDYQLLVTEPS